MKRFNINKGITLAVWILIAINIHAQTNNVGIGTTLPTEALQVKGNVKIDSIIHNSKAHKNVLEVKFAGTTTDGYKIKTNIPNGPSYNGMYLVKINGYAYGSAKAIDMNIVFYCYAIAPHFRSTNVTSGFGGWAPDSVQLANENGKVVIFLKAKQYFGSFNVDVYEGANGSNNDVYTEGWSWVDSALASSATEIVTYGKEKIEADQLYWKVDGNLGTNGGHFLGTTDPQRLRFRTNNIQRMDIDTGSRFGFNTNAQSNWMFYASKSPYTQHGFFLDNRPFNDDTRSKYGFHLYQQMDGTNNSSTMFGMNIQQTTANNAINKGTSYGYYINMTGSGSASTLGRQAFVTDMAHSDTINGSHLGFYTGMYTSPNGVINGNKFGFYVQDYNQGYVSGASYSFYNPNHIAYTGSYLGGSHDDIHFGNSSIYAGAEVNGEHRGYYRWAPIYGQVNGNTYGFIDQSYTLAGSKVKGSIFGFYSNTSVRDSVLGSHYGGLFYSHIDSNGVVVNQNNGLYSYTPIYQGGLVNADNTSLRLSNYVQGNVMGSVYNVISENSIVYSTGYIKGNHIDFYSPNSYILKDAIVDGTQGGWFRNGDIYGQAKYTYGIYDHNYVRKGGKVLNRHYGMITQSGAADSVLGGGTGIQVYHGTDTFGVSQSSWIGIDIDNNTRSNINHYKYGINLNNAVLPTGYVRYDNYGIVNNNYVDGRLDGSNYAYYSNNHIRKNAYVAGNQFMFYGGSNQVDTLGYVGGSKAGIYINDHILGTVENSAFGLYDINTVNKGGKVKGSLYGLYSQTITYDSLLGSKYGGLFYAYNTDNGVVKGQQYGVYAHAANAGSLKTGVVNGEQVGVRIASYSQAINNSSVFGIHNENNHVYNRAKVQGSHWDYYGGSSAILDSGYVKGSHGGFLYSGYISGQVDGYTYGWNGNNSVSLGGKLLGGSYGVVNTNSTSDSIMFHKYGAYFTSDVNNNGYVGHSSMGLGAQSYVYGKVMHGNYGLYTLNPVMKGGYVNHDNRGLYQQTYVLDSGEVKGSVYSVHNGAGYIYGKVGGNSISINMSGHIGNTGAVSSVHGFLNGDHSIYGYTNYARSYYDNISVYPEGKVDSGSHYGTYLDMAILDTVNGYSYGSWINNPMYTTAGQKGYVRYDHVLYGGSNYIQAPGTIGGSRMAFHVGNNHIYAGSRIKGSDYGINLNYSGSDSSSIVEGSTFGFHRSATFNGIVQGNSWGIYNLNRFGSEETSYLGGTLYGLYNDAHSSGKNAIRGSKYGIYNESTTTDTIYGDQFGIRNQTHTSDGAHIKNNYYGIYQNSIHYGTSRVDGYSYGFLMYTSSNGTDAGKSFALYENGDAGTINYFSSKSGFGTTAPVHPIHVGSGAHVTTAGVWTNASDARLKKNVQNSRYGLDAVLKLRAVDYDMIKTGEHQVGFIAQEVQKVIPEVVSGSEGDIEKGHTLGVSYGNMVPVLVNAIKELNSKIEVLEKENSALKSENAEIKAMRADIDKLMELVKTGNNTHPTSNEPKPVNNKLPVPTISNSNPPNAEKAPKLDIQKPIRVESKIDAPCPVPNSIIEQKEAPLGIEKQINVSVPKPNTTSTNTSIPNELSTPPVEKTYEKNSPKVDMEDPAKKRPELPKVPEIEMPK